jgi:hypothetical protein
MCTVVIHGTLARDETWWRDARQGGFLDALAMGLHDGGRTPDVWMIGGKDVRTYSALSGQGHGLFEAVEGRFRWTGQNAHDHRVEEGLKLALYLEALAEVKADETIDIVAHSHGGNLVKVATARLADRVRLGRVVFLAVPHCENASPRGEKHLYHLNARRLSAERSGSHPVLNAYSAEDTVQKELASAGLDSRGFAPGLPGFTPIFDAGRTDSDPAAAAAYDNLEVPTRLGRGRHVHSAMHGPTMGRVVGLWLARWPKLSGQQCLEHYGVTALTDRDPG